MCRSFAAWAPTSMCMAPRRWCAASGISPARRSWPPTSAPRCRSCSPGSPPRARRSSTGSITSIAAMSISRRSWRRAAPRSNGSRAMTDALKLRAEDEEDLAVISAVLQDALVAVSDMAYLPVERRLSGFRADEVVAVRRRGFHPRDGDRLLVLLAIRADPGALLLDFAGGASIRLEVGRILCHLDDLGEPWRTRWRPRHPVENDVK